MGKRFSFQKLGAIAALILFAPALALAAPKSVRDLMLETLHNTPNPAIDCRHILEVSENPETGEKSYSLSFKGIQNKIDFHNAAKINENRFPNELFLQYSKDISGSSRNYLQNMLGRLTSLWREAQGEVIKNLVNTAQKEAAKRTETVDGRERPGTWMPDYFLAFPYNREVFPNVARLIEDPSLYAKLPKSLQDFILQSIPKKSVGPRGPKAPTFDRIKLSTSRELETRLRAYFIDQDFAAVKKQLGEIADDAAENIQEQLINNVAKNRTISHWTDYMRQDGLAIGRPYFVRYEKLAKEYLRSLREKFPLDPNSSASLPNAKIAEIQEISKTIEALDAVNNPYGLTGPYFDGTKRRFHLRDRNAIVQYNPRLATMELVSANGEASNPDGPILHAIHGAGTTRSTGASLQSLISLFEAYGFNPRAVDSTDAGSGVMVGGELLYTTTNTERALQEARDTFGKPYDENGEKILSAPNPLSDNPLFDLGRSVGGTNVILTYALHPDSVSDGVFAQSFSNPWTLKAQVKNVQRQLQEGAFNGLIEGALADAIKLAEGGLDLLERSYQQAKELSKNDPAYKNPYKTFGNRGTLIQGNDDEDAAVSRDKDGNIEEGQMEVISSQTHFINRYMPTAHLFVLRTPLTAEQRARFTSKDSEDMEATHFLISNKEDLERADVANDPRYNDIPDINLPKLRSQSETVMALPWAYMDYIINGLPDGAEWPDPIDRAVQARLRKYRDRVAGPGRTMLEYYVDILNASKSWKQKKIHLTLDDIKNATPGRANKAEWMARVYRFWFVDEPARVLGIYKSEGLVP